MLFDQSGFHCNKVAVCEVTRTRADSDISNRGRNAKKGSAILVLTAVAILLECVFYSSNEWSW